QAEDGIRDFHVTGVQTCALPISTGRGGKKQTTLYRMQNQELNRPLDTDKARALGDIMAAGRWAGNGESLLFAEGPNDDPQGLSRSEERRVGKERRCRWTPHE